MGDRAAFGFRTEADGPTIWLYSHWGGSTQAVALAGAVRAAEPRWNDPSYATRITTSTLVGDEWASETGYGLTATTGRVPFFLDYPFALVVDWPAGLVLVVDEEGRTLSDAPLARFASDPFILVPNEEEALLLG